MRLTRMVVGLGLASVLCLVAGRVWAQDTNAGGNSDNNQRGRRGRGNFDPAEMQQRILDNIKDRLAFTNDTEWAAVQPLVQKVLDARRDVGFGGMGMFRGNRGGNGPDNGGRRNPFFQTSPEAETLQKALDDNAPAPQVKAMLEKYRAARKEKQAKLEAAQENLRKVLTSRQEAEAVLLGLLN